MFVSYSTSYCHFDQLGDAWNGCVCVYMHLHVHLYVCIVHRITSIGLRGKTSALDLNEFYSKEKLFHSHRILDTKLSRMPRCIEF